MSIVHHPEEALLLAYAAGAADEPTSLVVATHLALCAQCRRAVADSESAGGVLLEDGAPETVGAGSFETVLARLDTQEQRRPLRTQGVTPEPLRSWLGGELETVRWNKLASGLSHHSIMRRGNTVVRLLRATPGTAVSEHTHRGEEVTLVLTGGLGDHTGQYHRGDVQSMDSGAWHEPTALPGEDCIVLAVTTAPLKFKGLPMALFAKLMRF